MLPVSRSNVAKFLEDYKNVAVSSFSLWHIKKNKDTLLILGFNKHNVRDEILRLSVEDYSKGPLLDKYTNNMFWVFGILINNQEIFIKLEITKCTDSGEEKLTEDCLSFHFAEDKMIFPYK